MRALRLLLFFGLAAAASCGPATVRSAAFPDPDVACPAGPVEWNLEIRDQRATREGADRMAAAIRDSLQKSFPGCRWGSGTGSGTITIEVHRFAVGMQEGAWEAAVEWSVSARDASGHRLIDFEANEEVSRPNYRGVDNEKAAISEAFSKAMERTSKGLAGMSALSLERPRRGTAPVTLGTGAARAPRAQVADAKEDPGNRRRGRIVAPRGTDLATTAAEVL